MAIRISAPSLFVALALAFGAVGPAYGDDDNDHVLAHKLLSEGKIKPLAELMDIVRTHVPGDVLEVEFEAEKGYVYEFKVLRPDGRVQEVDVDASSGEIGKVEDDD